MLKKLKQVPAYGWIAGIGLFVLQFGLYRLGDFLSGVIGTKANAWSPKIAAIDDLVGVVAIFATIYVFSYVFWVFGPVAVSLTKKSNFYNFLIGILAAYLVGFLIFTFAPTYMDRVAEGLMNVQGTGSVFDGILQWVYSADGSEKAFNLFPSYHCLISVYCYLGIRKQPEISKGFKIYSFIMAVLICLSTQFTKQHFFLDMVGGVGIAIICYVIVEKLNPGAKLAAKKA
ncbi:MAG: phosphatase PAP2 family protein [Lachnospiraceae bacterium]|nr:phosphatase PAP2 family protein [Lachnospiraceae bacterium]